MSNISVSKEKFAIKQPLNTAVLFLIFNRLDTTKEVFEAIRQAKPPRLYIAADGARPNKSGELERVEAVRSYVLDHVDWDCEIETLFREQNLGCKTAVSEAITWFFENEEQGIILEDDCLPSQSFFWFCEEMLEYYKNDLRVWHVGGTNPIDKSNSSNEYYFSEYNRIWGWATWRRSWDKYDVEIPFWPEIAATNLLTELLGAKEAKKYKPLFEGVFNGEIDTWDYQWFLTRLLYGKAIIPKVNLISNIGFGGDATHTFDVESKLSKLERGDVNFPLVHPSYFLVDSQRDELWKRYSSEGFRLLSSLKSIAKRLLSRVVGNK